MTALNIAERLSRNAGFAGYLIQAAFVTFQPSEGDVEDVFHLLRLSDISPVVKRQIACGLSQTVSMTSREILGANLSALMKSKWAKAKGLNSNKKVGDKLQISDNTVGRIRRGQNSIGIDMLDLLAELFELKQWQLLVPNFNPSNPPMLRGMSAVERELYERLQTAVQAIGDLK